MRLTEDDIMNMLINGGFTNPESGDQHILKQIPAIVFAKAVVTLQEILENKSKS